MRETYSLRAKTHTTVARVREDGGKPRVHPNGFIQLDLEITHGTWIAETRLHVWPDGDDIPKQTTATTIHDHRFDMHSTVLTGRLWQMRYSVQLDERPFSHEIYVAQYPEPRKESVLMPSGVCVKVTPTRAECIGEEISYTQPRYTFHDTGWVGLTATLMTKTNEDVLHEPRVLVPMGQEPDNSFIRANVEEDLLWDYIERALI